jgi:glycosyltransferase involved in cell wall biosynthesis
MASGPAGRAWARFVATCWYPIKAIWNALAGGSKTVVATTNPFFLPFVMIVTRGIHRSPVIALLYDLYPDALEARGIVDSGSIGARLGTWMNRVVMRHADGVVFIGDHMASHARQRYGEPETGMVAVTGASRAEHVGVPAGQRYRSPDGLLLSYVGNLGQMHDWATAAEALPEVLSEDLRFVCAASGPGEPIWSKSLTSQSGKSAWFVGPLGDEEWRELLAETDISLVTLRSEAANTSIPSKLFSAMAAGCAIVAVAPAESDLAVVVESDNCGTVIAPGDAKALAAELRRMCEDRDALECFQKASLESIEARYDISKLAERWQDFIDRVESSRGSGKTA